MTRRGLIKGRWGLVAGLLAGALLLAAAGDVAPAGAASAVSRPPGPSRAEPAVARSATSRPPGPGRAVARPPGPGRAVAPIPVSTEASQPNSFFEPARFFPGLAAATAAPAPRGNGRLVGGLTSHHALAATVISQLFIELGELPPATVVVVGPNHENRGQRAITGRRPWATDFGTVAVGQGMVDRLVAAGLAEVDDETLSTEHAVGTLMPYLKYHAPNAKVVPLILERSVTPVDAARLAHFLAPLVGPDVLLIASVDFSHYLTAAEAEANDAVTMQAIRDFDLETLWRMGPDYLDSPPSLGLLLLTMRELSAAGPEVAAHTNSGALLGSSLVETTSYFTFKFRLPAP